ncbi:MAG: Sec-independent protein translocase subunit TatA/TatB [Phycisphaerales bacterium]
MLTLLSSPQFTLGFLGNIGWMEWLVIMTIMLLLFGRRLPEVGKSLGKGIVEFKKGLKGVEDDVNEQVNRPAQQSWAQPAPQMTAAAGGGATVPTSQPNTVGRADGQ